MKFIGEAAAFVWSYLRTIRPADILDIAVVAFLIYKIMTFVSRTGLAKVIRGILFLIAAMWLSTLLQLNVVSFLMGNTIELGFLALIILFQPELRRMLEQVGSSNISQIFGRSSQSKEKESALIQIIQACSDLSKSKTGALIIFEREIKLDDPIKTGSILDANTKSELLKNIFFPKSPLHDGAVIIRESKIVAAGCMLPLSSNPNLSRELGMRHRAGIGISEVSDAVAVVVSEETGSISVAVEGMLKRHLALDTFEKLLRNEILADEESRKGKGIFQKISLVKNNDRERRNKSHLK
jgi:diadenylate cyclase